jgi:hypothetical protein
MDIRPASHARTEPDARYDPPHADDRRSGRPERLNGQVAMRDVEMEPLIRVLRARH